MKIVLVLFALVVLQFAFCDNATAQAGPGCIGLVGNGCQINAYSIGPCPGWFNCYVEGPFDPLPGNDASVRSCRCGGGGDALWWPVCYRQHAGR